MERIKKLLILIFFLNNDMVQGDINEELLLAISRIQATMETVMQKVENMENTIKETETNLVSIRDDVKILHNEVETIKEEVKITSNYSGKFLEQIKVFKDEVLSLEEENRIKIDDIGLHFQGRQVRKKIIALNLSCTSGATSL